MNKTGKHCTVCQENFGDKYSFCPVCGTPLHSAETNKIEQFTNTPPTTRLENIAAPVASVSMNNGNFANHETTNNEQNQTSNFSTKEQAFGAKDVNNNKRQAQPKITPQADNFVVAKDEFVNHNPTMKNDGLFHITMLEEPSNAQKNVFRAGALAGLFLLLTTVLGIYIYDLYRYDINVAEVEVNEMITPVFASEDEPPTPEEKIKGTAGNAGGDGGGSLKEKSKPKGGGGGGDENPKEASFGKLPPASLEPQILKPSVDMQRLDKPSLPVRATIDADPALFKKDDRDIPYGLNSSRSYDPSNGPGRNGGIGDGKNGGVGPGDGGGVGPGRGGNTGGGDKTPGGGGKGGTGGNDDSPPPIVRPTPRPTPKPEVAAVTEPLQIRSKPRPNYTESARKNSVQGTVRLRVTFSASGQVTGITPVSGLPDGLTEQAIAAARQIQFSPQKKNGVPVSVTKTIEYGFNMY